ncbi:IclR family transcriptional regulator [Pseudonocardia sp. CA-107938]|uniref:IclR family transcriptional regulator n=1 Tax=Pseudonocardia sp. CA-107938 TaxID=3240021 RepID=UPI003D8AA413
MSQSVTERALALLASFRADHPELTLTELSRRSGLPLTTTHRLASELVAGGALERVGGRYRIGLWLWEVASLAPRGFGLREAAMPFLEDVYEATRQNVQLAVLATDAGAAEVVYLERLAPRHAVSVVTRVGGRMPVHATAVGRVLLAHGPRELQEAVLSRPLQRFTTATETDPDRLRSKLAEVRRTGVAITLRQVELVSLSVAAPVRDAGGEVVAAISVVAPVEDGAQRYVPVVVAAARAISRTVARTAAR